MKYLVDVVTPEDEEMVLTILEGLRKGHVVAFHALEAELPLAEVHDRILASLASPQVGWEQGLAQLGLG